jgi:hypothetical protein
MPQFMAPKVGSGHEKDATLHRQRSEQSTMYRPDTGIPVHELSRSGVYADLAAATARLSSAACSVPMHLAQGAATLDAEADRVGTSDVRGTRASSPGALHRSPPMAGAALLPGIADELAAERRSG